MQMCGLKWVNDNQIRNALNIARRSTCADRNNQHASGILTGNYRTLVVRELK